MSEFDRRRSAEGRKPGGPRRDHREERRDGGRQGGGDRRGAGWRGDDRRGGDRPRDDRRSDGRRDAGRPRDDRRSDPRRPDRAYEDKPAEPAEQAPQLAEDIEFSQLDPAARKELRSMPKEIAELVGKHLVAAGQLVDVDPEAALAHARYVKKKASRIAIVREAVGIAAYHAGEWAEALSEFRAVRRMTHTVQHVAIIADLERALERPERALDLVREVNPATLPPEVAAELRIVAAGARRDLGQLDAAVVALQSEDLDPAKRRPWSARLFYAYADNLLAAGRKPEAATWFMHAAQADVDDETDAAERAAELSE